MKSLIYVGMDVHKESYSLCTYLISTGEFIGETKIEAKPSLIKDYLDTIAKLLKEEGYTEIEFQTCYEAGCLGFSLYKEMVKLGIDCKIVAPQIGHLSPSFTSTICPQTLQRNFISIFLLVVMKVFQNQMHHVYKVGRQSLLVNFHLHKHNHILYKPSRSF